MHLILDDVAQNVSLVTKEKGYINMKLNQTHLGQAFLIPLYPTALSFTIDHTLMQGRLAIILQPSKHLLHLRKEYSIL